MSWEHRSEAVQVALRQGKGQTGEAYVSLENCQVATRQLCCGSGGVRQKAAQQGKLSQEGEGGRTSESQTLPAFFGLYLQMQSWDLHGYHMKMEVIKYSLTSSELGIIKSYLFRCSLIDYSLLPQWGTGTGSRIGRESEHSLYISIYSIRVHAPVGSYFKYY